MKWALALFDVYGSDPAAQLEYLTTALDQVEADIKALLELSRSVRS